MGTFGDEALMGHESHAVLLGKTGGAMADEDVGRDPAQCERDIASIVDETGEGDWVLDD